jgi:type I restriction enzyme S subunit
MKMQVQKYKKTEWGEIPEEWVYKRLVDLCDGKPCYGAAISAIAKDENLPRYVRITDIDDNGCLKNDNWVSISLNDARPYLLNEGQILFARTGATVGKTYLYRKEDGNCAFAGYLIRFIPNKSKLNSKYLFYFTHSDPYWKWLRSTQTEGVQPNVNANQYSNMLIPTPPLKEQQKIASILSNIDNLIQKTDQVIEQTQRLKKALINHFIIGDYDVLGSVKEQVPVDKQYVKLSSIAYVNPKNTLAKDIEYPFVEMSAIDEKTKSIKYFGKRVVSSGYAIFKNNDVIFARITPCTENGKICIVSNLNDYGIGSTEFIVLRSKDPNLVLPHFLNYYCQTDKVRNYAISQMRGATGRQRVPDNVFKNELYVLLPDLKSQKKIVKNISNMEQIINLYKIKRENEEALKKGLMQQLLTGKLRVKV